jgi:hypothetical protein
VKLAGTLGARVPAELEKEVRRLIGPGGHATDFVRQAIAHEVARRSTGRIQVKEISSLELARRIDERGAGLAREIGQVHDEVRAISQLLATVVAQQRAIAALLPQPARRA